VPPELTFATDGLLLLHTPLGVVFDSNSEAPVQTDEEPEILLTIGGVHVDVVKYRSAENILIQVGEQPT
jgi:hypothetical protein